MGIIGSTYVNTNIIYSPLGEENLVGEFECRICFWLRKSFRKCVQEVCDEDSGIECLEKWGYVYSIFRFRGEGISIVRLRDWLKHKF